MPAENRELLLLITETNDETEETKLQNSLKKINEIQCLALTFGSVNQTIEETQNPKK